MDIPRIGSFWEDVCTPIIRPQRAEYDMDDLGPEVFRLSTGSRDQYRRVDIDLTNMRDMTIKCSWFHPNKANWWPMPVVIYLHGNCGSRVDSLEVLHLLGEGFSLFTYDACGSGQSDGDYVSLGFYERQDLATVIEYLQGTKKISTIGLWGRSMGGVTSIMYASRDAASIQFVIADSPFSSLKGLCKDLVKQHAPVIPGKLVKAAVGKMQRRIFKLANFDIDDLEICKFAKQCVVPSFLFHGEDDDFVLPYHSQLVADNYAGSCIHHVVKGGHNSTRGSDVHDLAAPLLRLYLIDKPNAEAERRASGIPDPVIIKGTPNAPPPATTDDVTAKKSTGAASPHSSDDDDDDDQLDDEALETQMAEHIKAHARASQGRMKPEKCVVVAPVVPDDESTDDDEAAAASTKPSSSPNPTTNTATEKTSKNYDVASCGAPTTCGGVTETMLDSCDDRTDLGTAQNDEDHEQAIADDANKEEEGTVSASAVPASESK